MKSQGNAVIKWSLAESMAMWDKSFFIGTEEWESIV